LVVPKLSTALEVATDIPVVAGLVIVVEAIVRVPLALVRLKPVEALLVDWTEGVPVENVIPRAVAAVTESAGPPVALIEPAVTLMVPPLATMPAPALVVTASDEKEIVPVLETRFTAIPLVEFLFAVVAPKLKPPAAIVEL
jgi:hypothetical protein